MGCLCIFAGVFAYLFEKYPTETPDAVDVVASEIKHARQKKGQDNDA